MRVGVHVSIVGGLGAALERAKRLSCNTMQIFSRSPRGGPAPTFAADDVEAFDRGRRRAGIEPLVVHAPYIINLASPQAQVFRNSLRLYQEEYARCAQLRARFLVTHVGSHRGEGEEAGIARVAEALNRTLDGAQSAVMILLENTAGSGQGLGYQFEHLAAMRAQVERKDLVGICLDTAHLFAAGFPIQTAEGLEETLAQCDRVIGFEHVKLVHLNDSKSVFSSHVDRHWHIGQGQIGLEPMRRIVTHAKLRDLPFILETPKPPARPPGPPGAFAGAGGKSDRRAGEQDDLRNLAVVRRIARSTSTRSPHAAAGRAR